MNEIIARKSPFLKLLLFFFFYQFKNPGFFCLDLSESVSQSCPTLCDPMDYNPLGSYVHGILQARNLEWVPILFSRESS